MLNAYATKEGEKRTYLRGARFVKERNEYYPIPQEAIDNAYLSGKPTLVQNPAYKEEKKEEGGKGGKGEGSTFHGWLLNPFFFPSFFLFQTTGQYFQLICQKTTQRYGNYITI
nr:hypothetical protein [Fibrisoma montanum]